MAVQLTYAQIAWFRAHDADVAQHTFADFGDVLIYLQAARPRTHR